MSGTHDVARPERARRRRLRTHIRLAEAAKLHPGRTRAARAVEIDAGGAFVVADREGEGLAQRILRREPRDVDTGRAETDEPRAVAPSLHAKPREAARHRVVAMNVAAARAERRHRARG